VQYNKTKTTQTAEAIKTSIRNSILLYNETYLNKFGATMVLSRMQDAVDSVDLNAIVGSEMTLRLQKRFEPSLGVSSTYAINFNAELHRGTVSNKMTSTQFTVYDSNGVIRTAQIEEIPESYTGVSSIEVTNGGSGYTSIPTITITGDGSGATATPIVVNGKIQSIEILTRGADYSRATATISGGNGYGAACSVLLDAKYGTLRTVYFNEMAERQVIDSTAGTINYSTGLVMLNDLRVLTNLSNDGLIRLTIESEKGIISSYRNNIISIDKDDSSAITTELVTT
jgi:hypothetical protein